MLVIGRILQSSSQSSSFVSIAVSTSVGATLNGPVQCTLPACTLSWRRGCVVRGRVQRYEDRSKVDPTFDWGHAHYLVKGQLGRFDQIQYIVYRVAQKKRGHHLIANILKFHDRIAWKLVNFCNIICWTQSLTFCLKPSENTATVVYSHCTNRFEHHTVALFSLGGATARCNF